jgi:hypothetical protein
MIMNKKVYKTPAMKIVMLRQQVTLLAGSEGVNAGRDAYGTATEETWEN